MKKISRKKIIIACIIVFLVLIIAIVLIKSGIFINKKKLSKYGIDGVSFKAPSYWEYKEIDNAINLYPYEDNTALLNIITQKIDDFDDTSDMEYYLVISSMAENSEYFKTKDFKQKRIGNFNGAVSTYNWTMNNIYYDCYQNMFYEESTSTFYSFNYCEKDKINKETKKQINSVISSIEER